MAYVFNPFTGNLDTTDVVAFNGEVNAGTEGSPSLFFTGDPNTGIYSPGADQLAISTSGNGRLFVDASGNVGIKNASPSLYLSGATDLVIGTGSSAAGATIRSSTSSDGFIAFADGITGDEAYRGFIAYGHSTDSLRFATSGSERLRITSTGLVGIGTSNPQALLHLAGLNTGAGSSNTIRVTDTDTAVVTDQICGRIEFETADTGNPGVNCQIDALYSGSGGGSKLQFRTGFAGSLVDALHISDTGNVGIGTSSVVGNVDIAGNNPVVYIRDTKNTSYTGGEEFGRLAWYTNDSSGIGAHETAYIKNVNVGSATTPTPNLYFGLGANNATPTDRMVLTQTGVGIGTTSPSSLLELSSAVPDLRFTDTDGGYGRILHNVGSLSIRADEGNAVASSYINFTVDNTEHARIDSSGRLLVGTSSARTQANIFLPVQTETAGSSPYAGFGAISNANNTVAAYLILSKSRGTSVGSNTIVQSGDALGDIWFTGADGTDLSTGAARITAYVDGTPGANDMPGRLVFSTTADGASSPTERMRITNGGGTGIFCDATNDVLYVSSAAAAGTSRYLLIGKHSATGTITSGTISLLVFTNGNIQNTNNSYLGISDIKLKENIVDANSQWSDIKALQVRNYNFKEGQAHTQIGLIAQEVELVSPGLVSESPDRDEEGNDLGTVTKSVNYSVLYMKAVKALQEAMERIETLEAKVAALESA